MVALVASGQPAVVPTCEGQIGEDLEQDDGVFGGRFESIRGNAGELIFGGIFVAGGVMPPPPEVSFFVDQIGGVPMPEQVGSVAASFDNVVKLPPASAWSRNAANDGDYVAFASAVDGSMPNTMTIRIATFDETGSQLPAVAFEDVPTFPDPSLNDVGIAVDDQGRVTVAYSELPAAGARVLATRFDGVTGLPIGGDIPVTDAGRAATDIALLDPAGNRLIVPNSDFASIRGSIIDTTGPTPIVLPEFPISTTPAIFANLNPAVASNPQSGEAIVAWENISGIQGDPINIRGRRFDADGNPIGNDFQINTTTANAQAQPDGAYHQSGVSVVAWASEPGVLGNELDVFFQTYDAMGNPIGGETRANTETDGIQDLPAVRFLPEPDSQGRPQFVVMWRDIDHPSGTSPNGTGKSYKCFSIDGLEDPRNIFADGFESGDTTSWSDPNP